MRAPISPEVLARAGALLDAGLTSSKVARQLGVCRDVVRRLRPPKRCRWVPPPVPVRLHVVGPAAALRLELRRGPQVLAVLGTRKGRAWDLTAAGDAHQRSLQRVLPLVEARDAAPMWETDAAAMPAHANSSGGWSDGG